jgi:hypothetical protein
LAGSPQVVAATAVRALNCSGFNSLSQRIPLV